MSTTYARCHARFEVRKEMATMSKISQCNMETGTQRDDTIHLHEFQDRGMYTGIYKQKNNFEELK